MSRPVEVGDYVLVDVNNQNYPLVISRIDQNGIVAGDYLIVPQAGGWQVFGYQIPHNVSFAPGPPAALSFTGLPELDSLILLNLDPKSLLNACQTNVQINQICQDDLFWRYKMENDYPELIEYKPKDLSFRQQYISLHQIKDPYRAINEGRLDILINLEREGVDLAKYNLVSLADAAVRAGDFDILEWLDERGIRPTYKATQLAASFGMPEMLNWLEQRGMQFGPAELSSAASTGNLEAVNWLLDRGIIPTTGTMIGVVSSGLIPILDAFLARGIIPDEVAFKRTIYDNQFPVLQWAYDRNIPIPRDVADVASKLGQLDVLNWLAERGVTPHDVSSEDFGFYGEILLKRMLNM